MQFPNLSAQQVLALRSPLYLDKSTQLVLIEDLAVQVQAQDQRLMSRQVARL
jgi:hypothetical protein